MEDLFAPTKTVLSIIFQGCADAMRIDKLLILLKQDANNNNELKTHFISCVFINLLLISGFEFIFFWGFNPFIKYILFDSISHTDAASTIAHYIYVFIVASYYIFWAGPLYIISLFINREKYNDIVVSINKIAKKKITHLQRNSSSSNNLQTQYNNSNQNTGIIETIQEGIYLTVLISAIYTLIGLIEVIPWIGRVLSIILSSWLLSLIAFDNKLMKHNYDLKRRLDYIEKNWAYMLGYGLPYTLIYNFFRIYSYFLSVGVMGVIYPVAIILSYTAGPTFESSPYPYPRKIRIFEYPWIIADKTITWAFLFLDKGKQSRGKLDESDGRQEENENGENQEKQSQTQKNSNENDAASVDSDGSEYTSLSMSSCSTASTNSIDVDLEKLH